MISIHLYNVMQYASVKSVEAAAIEGRPGTAEIVYVPESSGKIEFVRESDGFVQILTEYASDPSSGQSEGKFTWSGKEDEKSSLRVTYRSGIFLSRKTSPWPGPVCRGKSPPHVPELPRAGSNEARPASPGGRAGTRHSG